MLDTKQLILKLLTESGGGGGGPIGSIVQYGGAVEPDGWFICNGRELSRDTYADLFDAIGTTFGAGDGSTTFNIPDFRGRTAIGSSLDHALGSSGGEEEHTLTIGEMPNHEHNARMRYKSGSFTGYGLETTSNVKLTWSSGKVQNTGGDQPHNNMQPYLTSNYIIKWK